MKITQKDNQIELRSSGLGQLILGIGLIPAGIGIAYVTLATPDDSGKKAPAWLALVGVAMLLAGIATIIFSKNRTVTIEKGGNTTVSAKRMLGGGPAEQQSVPTASIVAVRLSTYIQNDSTGNTQGVNYGNSSTRRSILSLVLNNNDLIEVGNSGSGGFNFNGMNVSSLIAKAPLSKEANQVASFLGVPLQADDASSIAGAVRSLKNAFEGQGQSQAQSPAPPQQTAQTTQFNPAPQIPVSSPPQPQPTQQTPQPSPPNEDGTDGRQTPPSYTPPPAAGIPHNSS